MGEIYKQRGFSIIELLVVVAAMIILVGLSFTVPRVALDRGDDYNRVDDVDAIARDFERFYLASASSTQPTYPSTVYATNKDNYAKLYSSLGAGQLRTPGSQSDSLIAATSASAQSPTTSQYIYQPLRMDGSLCVTSSFSTSTSASDLCVRYILYYRNVSDNTVVMKHSVRQQ